MTRRPTISVVIAEDHDDGRVSLQVLLELHGLDVRTARDGEEAWALIQADPPDLVLSDVRMPRLDGLGLARRVRADPRLRHILMIALSGLDSPKDLGAARDAGFDGHVVKPLRSEVLDRLLDHLRSRRT
jgi:two-component system chemotaxis sensor kinase CheA